MESREDSPRAFYQSRRPELFSDSQNQEWSELDKSLLDHHLANITTKKQENNFEEFARKLIQRTICPNLLPQTGPLGGGDSKVDSETHPIAESLALGWWIGNPRRASNERWAFAFSAKAKWRDKLKDDIKKIAATGRGYTVAYFVTNQPVKDKNRSALEDDLRKEFSLDVRILDRTWILKSVIEDGNEDLAIEELGVSATLQRGRQVGPRDLERENEFNRLEQRVQSALQEEVFSSQLVDDCLKIAKIARELEKPRIEVDGFFERAERLSEIHGTEHQRIVLPYDRAWTYYFWYEDFPSFLRYFEQVASKGVGSKNVYHLELYTNLWHLLAQGVVSGFFDKTEVKYENHAKQLVKSLEKLSGDINRPSTAYHAKTLLLLVHMQQKIDKPKEMDEIFGELKEIINKASHLPDFPLETQLKTLTELGDFFSGRPTYDQLFETIIHVSETQSGEIAAAKLLAIRGKRDLKSGRPYNAIKHIGQALRKLYRNESKYKAIEVLLLQAAAYRQVGLKWAARGTLLAATSLAINDLWKYEDINIYQAECVLRLQWIELELGRLPQLLAWHEVWSIIKDALINKGYDEEIFLNEGFRFDHGVATLFLDASLDDLKRLPRLPKTLKEMGLLSSQIALLYALGHEEEIAKDELYMAAFADRSFEEFFTKLYNSAIWGETRPQLVRDDEHKQRMTSRVLGCQIDVVYDNSPACLALSESLLAAIESFLATGTLSNIVSREPILTIKVSQGSETEDVRIVQFELKDVDGHPEYSIHIGELNPYSISMEHSQEIQDAILHIAVETIARITIMDNPDETFRTLLEEELVIDRSVGFTGSFATVGNILGHWPKFSLSNWIEDQAEEFALQREVPWFESSQNQNSPIGEAETNKSELKYGQGDPPADLLDLGRVHQSEMKTVSVIREDLWDRAKWAATGFMAFAGNQYPPTLALVFEDAKAAQQIFRNWREEYGSIDEGNAIRLTVIKGISRENPLAYRLLITSNPQKAFVEEGIRYAFFASRSKTMEPTSKENLGRFLESYNHFNGYFFAPAIIKKDLQDIEIFDDVRIAKSELSVREAWEIGRNDFDLAGIYPDDNPIIPDGTDNPPVVDLLEWKTRKP